MPYPPPPGPPPVGEFQAIGLLPAPQLPDVTGHGGDFLETDGVIPQWEPVTGVLPDPAGHAGEFLTTPDGVTVSWAPGGGGGGITTVGALTTPTADAAIISGGDTLQLAPADQTHPGVASIAQQDYGGLKLHHDGATHYVFDIRNYGAISSSSPTDYTTGLYDCSDAIEAAIAAWTQISAEPALNLLGKVGGIYIPEGNWYISRPIIPARGTVIFGDGPYLSNIIAGSGTASTPSLVQGFSGAVIEAAGSLDSSRVGNGLGLPVYDAPLVGATGRSYDLRPYDAVNDPGRYPPAIVIDDCYGWSTFLSWTAGALRLRFWVNVTAQPTQGVETPIISSLSLEIDRAIGIFALSNLAGTAINFKAYLTTYNSGKQFVLGTDVALGIHYIELSYDGSHMWFYVDGVHQGNVVMTGRVDKKPWEVTSIGANVDWVTDGGYLNVITGSIFSVELGKVAGHTGTGSYTPPTSMHTADTNTLWLMNCDLGDPPVQSSGPQWPFLWQKPQSQAVLASALRQMGHQLVRRAFFPGWLSIGAVSVDLRYRKTTARHICR